MPRRNGRHASPPVGDRRRQPACPDFHTRLMLHVVPAAEPHLNFFNGVGIVLSPGPLSNRAPAIARPMPLKSPLRSWGGCSPSTKRCWNRAPVEVDLLSPQLLEDASAVRTASQQLNVICANAHRVRWCHCMFTFFNPEPSLGYPFLPSREAESRSPSAGAAFLQSAQIPA